MKKHKDIAVIGGGESILKLVPSKKTEEYSNALETLTRVFDRAYTIGINDAMVRSVCDIGVSMDRRWAEWRINDIRGKEVHLRRYPERWDGMKPFMCDNESHEFSDDPDRLNGQNSGYCGFNLAYKMHPERIFLFGFDMQGYYWYPPYPWTVIKNKGSRILHSWREGFEVARRLCEARNIEVYVVGESAISCFTKITFDQFLSMTNATRKIR